MGRLIVIASGKGGVGKTTTAINLGAAVNYLGCDSLVVDANLTTPNIGLHLGSPEVPVSLNYVLQGKAELFEAVYGHESGMKIIPSSLSIKELQKIDPDKLKEIKKDLKKFSEYVFLDTAAGLGREAMSVIEIADEIIIVTNPEIPAITDALKTVKIAEKMGKRVLGVIITKVKKDKIELQPETVKEMLEVPVLGMVPDDVCVRKSLNLKNPVVLTHPRSKAGKAYKEIAARILGKEYNYKRKAGFFKKFFRGLGF